MKTMAAVMAMAVGLACPAAVSAQDTVSSAATRFFDACIDGAQGDTTECACATGFYGGRLKADEFMLIAIVTEYTDPNGNITDMAALQASMESYKASSGMSETRYLQIMERFSTMSQDGAYGDRVCIPLRSGW